MNTTTCYNCGSDYPDTDMVPRPGNDGGELCPGCVKELDRSHKRHPDTDKPCETCEFLGVYL